MNDAAPLDRRVQLVFAWCGPVGLLLFLVGFWFVAGLVPPPTGAESARKIALFYRENKDQLRAGLLIAMIATPLLIPFSVLLTLRITRSDPRLAPLAYTQLICGVMLIFLILLPVVLMGVAAFRPGRAPQLTQLMNDTAFTIFLWAFAPATVEYIALGTAALMDRSPRPLFPRWMGYLDFALAAIFAFGAPTLFVRSGPFGWDGALAFWAVLIAFGVWVTLAFRMLLADIARQEGSAPAAPLAADR